MRILGHKPSEIRKALWAFAYVFGFLLAALPTAGLPAAWAAGIATTAAITGAVATYLSRNDVAEVIDSTDNIGGD
ncbi:Uncharacterised protein [Mycobacteroides abscessus subsp. abscessus]|nr:Uncharacterised protein [Mycobacteroides abscessus subsp. abscessus]